MTFPEEFRNSAEAPIPHGSFGIPFEDVRNLLDQISAGEDVSVFNESAMRQIITNSNSQIAETQLPNAIGTPDNYRRIAESDHDTDSLRYCIPSGCMEAHLALDHLEGKGIYGLVKNDFWTANAILRIAAAMRREASKQKIMVLATFMTGLPLYQYQEDLRATLAVALVILDQAGIQVLGGG